MTDALSREHRRILQAVARGWCHEGNTHKEMDTTLANAIAEEIMALRSLDAVIEDTIRECARVCVSSAAHWRKMHNDFPMVIAGKSYQTERAEQCETLTQAILALDRTKINAAPQVNRAVTDSGAKNTADTYREPAGAAPDVGELVKRLRGHAEFLREGGPTRFGIKFELIPNDIDNAAALLAQPAAAEKERMGPNRPGFRDGYSIEGPPEVAPAAAGVSEERIREIFVRHSHQDPTLRGQPHAGHNRQMFWNNFQRAVKEIRHSLVEQRVRELEKALAAAQDSESLSCKTVAALDEKYAALAKEKKDA